MTEEGKLRSGEAWAIGVAVALLAYAFSGGPLFGLWHMLGRPYGFGVVLHAYCAPLVALVRVPILGDVVAWYFAFWINLALGA